MKIKTLEELKNEIEKNCEGIEVDDYLADANHLPISIDDDLINFVKGK